MQETKGVIQGKVVLYGAEKIFLFIFWKQYSNFKDVSER